MLGGMGSARGRWDCEVYPRVMKTGVRWLVFACEGARQKEFMPDKLLSIAISDSKKVLIAQFLNPTTTSKCCDKCKYSLDIFN